MFDEYLEPPGVERLVPHAPAVQVPVVSASTPSSTTIDQDAPSTNYSPSSSVVQPPILPQGVTVGLTIKDNPFAQADNEPFENVFAPEPSSDESSSGDRFASSLDRCLIVVCLEMLDSGLLRDACDNMADENFPALAPIRTDDQILPFAAWVPIGKRNFARLLGLIGPDTQFFRCIGGIITSTNVDYAKLIWEEFIQAIQTFLTDKANLGSPTKKDRKDKTHVIPYCRFTKLIICHLGRKHNLHQRSESPLHLAEEDLCLGNLKFVSKGENDEVFGMQIPNVLITDSIRNAPYYNAYLEMVAKHDQIIAAKNEGKKKPATTKQLKPKSVKEKSIKPAPAPKPKSSLQLIDEEEPTQPETEPEPEHQGKGEEYDVERAIQMSLESFQAQGQVHVGGMAIRELVAEATRPLPVVEGKGKAIVTDEQVAQSLQDKQWGDTEILQIGEEQGDDVANMVNLEEKTIKIDEGQAGSDLDPEPMHDDFIATMYPQVHESLKHPDEEYAQVENPLSLTGTLSSMKNLDAFTFGDQFFNDKPTEEESNKANMETKVKLMVTVPIHQASSYVPLLSTLVIDITPPKPVSPPIQATTDLELAACVTALENKFSDFEQKSKTLDNMTQNLGSRVFTLELQDLPHKIDQTVYEVVKETVHIALQAPLRDRFRDLAEADMKEMLHQRMFKSGSYKSHQEHVALYEALEASMERAQRDEFLAEKVKSRKRQHDDQDPPSPPPKDSDESKKKRHDSDALEAPSSSSKQKSVPHSEQPVEDVPLPNDMDLSDSEDTDTAHLPKIKTIPDWFKPVPEEDRPATLEPNWVIPLNDLLEPENNWANALASSKSDLKGSAFKVVRPYHDNNISLQFQMEECHLLLTDQVDLVNPEGHRVVPDVSKPLPLGGPPDFGLEELVPSLWIESERDYDISVAYGISHWWFKGKEFYITRHSASSNHCTVRSHMWILSVVGLRTYKRYGYAFLKEIVLHRANYNEYKISEADFKNLHPNDFEDLYLLHIQDLQLGIESYQTKLNLTQPDWDAFDFLFKEDYTIVSKPRAVIYRDKNDHKKMMRETKVHKFSDGTLNRILDKLDHMVKDFKLFKYNPGMEIRIWSEDDRRRSKEFMEVIERRLKIRRIFRNLESFIGRRLRDVDYRLIQRIE
ncbi:hypothetical protein Tco_0923272 [Tanacetum coccineum]|uniref:Histone deacetylase 14 n=1 Tax=Tanacetum coccineum TaxID=301880 RepID=A0ABQ5D2Y7_9ASTR